MTSQASPVVSECGVEPAVAAAPRRGWKRWIAGVGLLMLISGLVLHRINQKRLSRLEQAAGQIPIGSDWNNVWRADKELWENAVVSWTAGGATTDEFAYGGPLNSARTQMGMLLAQSNFDASWYSWFIRNDQYPVIISVDQNGNGNVVGVRVRGVWRRANSSTAHSSSLPE